MAHTGTISIKLIEMASSHISLSTLSLLSFLSLFLLLTSVSQAVVPPSETFRYVNEGDFGDYIVEYDANYRVLDPFNDPFQLCFYNTTPGAYTLALRMGTVRSESVMRWVWEANRGNPVGENATFSLGSDGNLVLAHADGRIAWQSGTANKGVVGFQLLPNGNMVLHDAKGNFIWQSFDSPTDTLLVGQSLKANGVNKLVSRASEADNSNGRYSLVLEAKRLALYYTSSNSPRPMIYWTSVEWFTLTEGNMVNLTLTVRDDSDEQDLPYFLLAFEYQTANPSSPGGQNMAFSRYNNTLSYLRLGVDGNLRFYTYSTNVQGRAWEVIYTFLDRESREGECQLPERCGKFGLCEDSQCVACPSPNGLLGWSKDCVAQAVTSCKASDFRYYKLDGVDHFTVKYSRGDGPVDRSNCESKCTKDCKCMGYFYHSDTSRCWIAYDLKTMTRVGNSTRVAYIKTPIK